MPSLEYSRSVADSAAHHARSKTFSGSLIIPYTEELIAISRRNNVLTALDYGCGKAKAWLDPYPAAGRIAALDVHLDLRDYALYDPCVPSFAHEEIIDRRRSYDLVILCSVLFWIPTEDLGDVLDRVYGLAKKAVFIAEKIGEPKKHHLTREDLHPRGWRQADWADLIVKHRKPGIDTTLATRTIEDGVSKTQIVRL